MIPYEEERKLEIFGLCNHKTNSCFVKSNSSKSLLPNDMTIFSLHFQKQINENHCHFKKITVVNGMKTIEFYDYTGSYHISTNPTTGDMYKKEVSGR